MLFDPPGNPVLARDLLIFTRDQESCNIGELPQMYFPLLSVTLPSCCFFIADLYYETRVSVVFSRLPMSLCLLLLGYFLHAPATPFESWVKWLHLASNLTGVEGLPHRGARHWSRNRAFFATLKLVLI